MNALERRASFSLALIYALRMLGLFMVLPVFTLEARHYEGGNDPTAVGLALGLYGLVQAGLQIPFGLAADRFGRKRVIVAGLLLFALGSVVAAMATSVTGLAWGRALQGGGAISAAVSALLADQTRESVRTKGMALIGASIGLMFALSLVVGPLLSAWGGLPGIFWITSVLAVGGIAVVLWWTPAEVPGPPETAHSSSASVWTVLRMPDLARLNLGVFILYTVQLATWVAVPALLIQAGVEKSLHGWVYLPAVLLSFVVMGATLFPMERRGRLRPLFLVSIASVMLVQAGLIWQSMGSPCGHWLVTVCLFLWLQCAGSQPAQPGLALGARRHPRHRAGHLQHASVAWDFCRRRFGRLAGQVARGTRPVHGVCPVDGLVAGGGLGHGPAAAHHAAFGNGSHPTLNFSGCQAA